MRRKATGVSPRALDAVLNGLKVYIRRRPADGVAYATSYDFSKFVMAEPLETMRLSFDTTEDLKAVYDNLEADPRVKAVVDRYNAGTTKDLM